MKNNCLLEIGYSLRKTVQQVKKGCQIFMNQKVSVIVPVYNTEEFLQECLQSIAGQSYIDLQVIIVKW